MIYFHTLCFAYFFAYKKKHIAFFGETYKGRGTV